MAPDRHGDRGGGHAKTRTVRESLLPPRPGFDCPGLEDCELFKALPSPLEGEGVARARHARARRRKGGELRHCPKPRWPRASAAPNSAARNGTYTHSDTAPGNPDARVRPA